MLELLNLDLGRFQFRPRHLVPLALAAPVFQPCLANLLEAQRPCSHLLVAYIVLEGDGAVVLPCFKAFLDDLYPFLLGRAYPPLGVAA